MAKSKWTSRIVGHDRVDPESLTGNPQNFRRHPQKQRDVLAASIRELGFVKSVLVSTISGFICDGHARVWAALDEKQRLEKEGKDSSGVLIDVEYIDLSPEEEKKALLILDKISELATVDANPLDELLRDVQTGEEAIASLLDEMATDAGILEGVEDEFDDIPGEGKTTCPECGHQF